MWRARGLQDVAPPKLPRSGPRRGGCGDGKKRGTSRQPFLSPARQSQVVAPWIGMGAARRRGCPQSLGDIRRLAGCALLARTLTFGKFLHRAGLPRREAWELLMEPVVSVFRVWAWCKGSTSESTSWK